MSSIASRYAHLSPLKRALLAVESMQAKLDAAERAKTEPVAIVGMGLRFPGGANDPESFWRLLRDGVDAIGEAPRDRWDVDALYDPDPQAAGKMSTRWGGFLTGIDQFDPQFFGISPREAMGMDPQQRILLEVCWEALERAGQAPDQLAGSQTGVFLGIISSDYSQLYYRSSDPGRIDKYFGTGTALSISAGRLSYVLGVHGPSLAVDTACSSSLVTVHLACQSLRARECDLALAGGVNLILTPEGTVYFSKLEAMAADGRCKTFDARADGFVRSDGCGIVVLKRLSDALAAGDPVLALIRGSAVNQDGRSGGLTAPNGPAQQAVIRAALAAAGVEPAQVGYVEAHGTGTALGDPMEVQALGAVMGAGRPKDRPLAIGSVKTNLGHTEAAAGVAGLMKAVLALQHGEIPPHLHFEKPSPHIAWDEWPVVVPTVRTPWPNGNGRRFAGVSSFGFSGTNAHVVLEEAPKREETAVLSAGVQRLLPLSARNPEALAALAQSYRELLAGEKTPAAADVAYTASLRRNQYEHRLSVVGRTPAELAANLEAFLRGDSGPGVAGGFVFPGQLRQAVFVFPGQGGQWPGMARDLQDNEPVFLAAIEQCARAMQAEVSWSLLDVLHASAAESLWSQIDVLQPALFALQVSLAALWRSWGIEPAVVIGHSMGEVAAAHVAGILRLEDAVRIICRRSALLKRVRGRGAMAVVELSMADAAREVEGHEQRLAVAVSNSPRSTVLSGDPEALRTVLEKLERGGVFCRWVNVDVASHSPHVDVLGDALLEQLAGVQPQAAKLPFLSTVNGQICAGPELVASYWVRNLREPVQFWPAVEKLLGKGHDVFLELSPHPTLAPAIQEGARSAGKQAAALPSLRREEPSLGVLLSSLGALYCLGCPVQWRALYPNGGRCVPLPTYPWQRERFWLEEAQPTRGTSPAGRAGSRDRPLHGEQVELASPADTHCWRLDLAPKRIPFLADHRIRGAAVLPAAACIDIVLEAARDLFGEGPLTLEQLRFDEALFLPAEGFQEVQLILSADVSGAASFHLSSRRAGDGGEPRPWTQHASGMLRKGLAGAVREAPGAMQEIRLRCQDVVAPGEYYQALADRGLEYGPSFRGLAEIQRRGGEATAEVRLPESEAKWADAYEVHPALLDAAFQVLAATLRDDGDGATYLPASVGAVLLHSRPGARSWAYARLRSETDPNAAPPETLSGDIWMLDADGGVLLEVEGLRVRRLEGKGKPGAKEPLEDWLYGFQWEPQPLAAASLAVDGCWWIFADQTGVGKALGERLQGGGGPCITVMAGSSYRKLGAREYQVDPARPEHFRRLLRDIAGETPRGIVHLWSLDAAPAHGLTSAALEKAQDLGTGAALHLVQALAQAGWRDAPRLWLVTRGAQRLDSDIEPVSVAQAPLWGLGRAIAHEHSEFRCACVDLDSTEAGIDALGRELVAGDREDQLAFRGGQRYAARLRRAPSLTFHSQTMPASQLTPAGDRPFALEIDSPGVLDRLTLRAFTRRAPGPGEVEVEVHAAGLNFLDVLSAMGQRPDAAGGDAIRLGGECAGTVVAVGEGVNEFRVGESVVALGQGAFRSYVTTRAMFAAHKPERLNFEEAAGMPIVFMTAWYALHTLGHLAAGERILIHCAAGGVGLAAVQLAQRAGAEVFATAGSEEKREYLRSLGVQRVMDSRSTRFADEILAATGDSGVNLVLNSLAGAAISYSLALLAPFGRFLEIGKRDIYQNRQVGLAPFRKNLSYFAIDLARMFDERPALVQSLLRDVMLRAQQGTLDPIRLRTYPIDSAADAFRDMAQARHTGKIVFTLRDHEALIEAPAAPSIQIREDASYLLTGGLGGLGLTIAAWLVSQGARNLALVSRGEPSEAARGAVAAMEQAGARVLLARADVAQEAQLVKVLSQVAAEMPPLRGIVHAAGVLDDGLLLQLDRSRLAAVAAPKIAGAWNLHSLTLQSRLDFFVLCSSAAGWLGSPGQGNYAAANTFLDALAEHRRAMGLPALSINWGPWAEVGLAAARENRGSRLSFRGIASMTPEQGAEAFARLLGYGGAQVAVMALNLRQWRQSYPKAADLPLVADLLKEEAGAGERVQATDRSFRDVLLAAEPAERGSLLEAHVREQLGQVLRLAPSRIEVRTPLRSLGIDSLMALELRNRLETTLGLTLSATMVWNYPTISALVPFLAERLGLGVEAVPHVRAAAPGVQEPAAGGDLDRLSEEEMAALLAQELDALAQENSS